MKWKVISTFFLRNAKKVFYREKAVFFTDLLTQSIYTSIIYEHRSNTNDSLQVPVVSKARFKTALSVYEEWVSFFFLNFNYAFG